LGYHAVRSPSSAHRWVSCTASIGAQKGLKDPGNEDARGGTTCHQASAECLINNTPDASGYLGRKLVFWTHPESESQGETWLDEISERMATECELLHEVEVTQVMVDAIDSYITFIRNLHTVHGGDLLVETRVPVDHITLEQPDAAHAVDEHGDPVIPSGTSDTILLCPPWLIVADAKFGRKKVMAYDVIEPESMDPITLQVIPPKLRMNLQLALYMLGTLRKYGSQYPFTHATAIIVQPFLDHTSEYTCTIEELEELGRWITSRAREIDTNPRFDPSEDNCHFCRASGQCKAQQDAVAELVFGEFMDAIDLDTAKPVPIAMDNKLGSKYAALPMIEEWMKSIHRLVRQELDQGRPVMRNDGKFYHLVPGRASKRMWKDPQEAEATLKAALPEDVIYEKSLISPTTVESLAKRKRNGPPPLLSEEQWETIQATLIKQTPGEQNPVIALSTDPREPLPGAADGFEFADEVPADLADLFDSPQPRK
jgi:hypothetical protein